MSAPSRDVETRVHVFVSSLLSADAASTDLLVLRLRAVPHRSYSGLSPRPLSAVTGSAPLTQRAAEAWHEEVPFVASNSVGGRRRLRHGAGPVPGSWSHRPGQNEYGS